MRLPTLPLAAAVCAVAVLCPAPAAASEGESALSVYLGYGTYAVVDEDERPSGHGTVIGLDFERGVSDALSLRVSGGGGGYLGDDRTTYSGQFTVGITYLLDVVKYVPYVNVGLGGIVIGGGGMNTEFAGLLELGGGVDILHSRSFSYGVQLRFESFIEQTAFFTAGVRATWRWGFF
jgi:hypothetical protein